MVDLGGLPAVDHNAAVLNVVAPATGCGSVDLRDELVNALEADPSASWAGDLIRSASSGTRCTSYRVWDVPVDLNTPGHLIPTTAALDDDVYVVAHCVSFGAFGVGAAPRTGGWPFGLFFVRQGGALRDRLSVLVLRATAAVRGLADWLRCSPYCGEGWARSEVSYVGFQGVDSASASLGRS